MTRSLLPPRGVHVPTYLVYDPLMPPALLQTWIQLRGLAWGRTVTPPVRMQDLATLTGKCSATIYKHMAQLRLLSALSWRTSGLGMIVVSFSDLSERQESYNGQLLDIPTAQDSQLENKDSTILDSLILDSPILNSQNLESPPPSLISPLSSSSIPGSDSGNQGSIKRVKTLKPHNPPSHDPVNVNARHEKIATAAEIYRSVVCFKANNAQIALLETSVTDLELWRASVAHWVEHGWNPRNLRGMLELYERGGPSACLRCRAARAIGSPPGDAKPGTTPLAKTMAAIEELRREQPLPGPHR
jgi:hypothetical protein